MFAMNSVYKPSGYNPEFSNRPLHNNSCSLNSNSISGVNSNRVSQSNLVTIVNFLVLTTMRTVTRKMCFNIDKTLSVRAVPQSENLVKEKC